MYAHLIVHTSLFSDPLSNLMTNCGLCSTENLDDYLNIYLPNAIDSGIYYDVSITFWY